MSRSLIILILIHGGMSMAQSRKGIELYHYTGYQRVLPSLSARAYYQSSEKWYAEARCNYEEEETYAFSIGKTFLKDGDWTYSFTPAVGIAVGRLQGVSLGMNGSLSHKSVTLSSSVQYGISLAKRGDNLFSWSELNWQLSDRFYMGCTVQTLSFDGAPVQWEPGIQMGLCFKGWSMPLYVFQPTSGKRYFALGICGEWKK